MAGASAKLKANGSTTAKRAAKTRPWTFKVRRRGGNGCEEITFYFQGGHFMRTLWYPPWRNELERKNARQIVGDLNYCFENRNRSK
jgi:hypothetical protein